jgi:hypothetical protein
MWWDGSLDELRYWKVARTAAQIRADMFQGGTLANSTGLVGRWNCDEGTSTSVASTVNSLTGTATASTVWAGAGTFTYGTSTLKMTGSSKNINYTGDETIGHLHIDGGQTTLNNLSVTDGTDTFTCSSVTIDSGTTFTATSGTTTITSETSGTGRTLSNAGTFIHNKGLVRINIGAGTTQTQNGPFWDLEQAHASTDFLPEEALTIYNNLDLVGDFDFQNNAHHLTVHGNMTIGDGSTTTRYNISGPNTNNLTVGGTLHITTGATADIGAHGTVNVGGIRNTGGSIS